MGSQEHFFPSGDECTSVQMQRTLTSQWHKRMEIGKPTVAPEIVSPNEFFI